MFDSTVHYHRFRLSFADFSMVDFIKPKFLGTKREFGENYATPIQNGQHKDSTPLEVQEMKVRSYILHKKLSKFVQVSSRCQ